MASRKQLEGNRTNAKNSTGPRTKGGKARSRLNSWKHGLTAKMLIIVGERAEDFEELRGRLMEEYDPQSVLESELVEDLAGTLWRRRRVPFFEAAILAYRQAHVAEENAQRYEHQGGNAGEEMSDEELSVHMGEAFIEDAVWGDGLGKLARHKAALMNDLMKTVQMLLMLQDNRVNRNSGPVMIEAVALKRAA